MTLIDGHILDDDARVIQYKTTYVPKVVYLCPNDGSEMYEEEAVISNIACLYLSCQKCKFSTTAAPEWSENHTKFARK